MFMKTKTPHDECGVFRRFIKNLNEQRRVTTIVNLFQNLFCPWANSDNVERK